MLVLSLVLSGYTPLQCAESSDTITARKKIHQKRVEVYTEIATLQNQLRTTVLEDGRIRPFCRALSSMAGFLAGYVVADQYAVNGDLSSSLQVLRNALCGVALGLGARLTTDFVFSHFFTEKMLPTVYSKENDPLTFISTAFGYEPQNVTALESWVTKIRTAAVKRAEKAAHLHALLENTSRFSSEFSVALALMQKNKNRARFALLEQQTEQWVEKLALLDAGIKNSFKEHVVGESQPRATVITVNDEEKSALIETSIQ